MYARRVSCAALCLAALLSSWAAGAQTADRSPSDAGLERLQAFLEQVQTLQAGFRQEIINGDEEVVEEATGRVSLQRPDRFRWDYEKPYERVVLADGSRLWLYEADLEQVTVRALADGLGDTPAALLSGDRKVLERFEFVSSWRGEDVLWVRLRPRAGESDFDSVAIGFRGEQPVQLELHDRLGQKTRLSLTGITLNKPIAADAFRFVVPEGVDVIREGEL